MLCMAPLPRGDENVAYVHPDPAPNNAWPLASYENWIESFAYQYGAAFLPQSAFDLTWSDYAPDKLHLKKSGHLKLATTVYAKIKSMGWI